MQLQLQKKIKMNNGKTRRLNMPSKIEIVEYWLPLLIHKKYDLDYYYDEVLLENGMRKHGKVKSNNLCNMCFACTVQAITERAHILSIVKGGNNAIINLHLLCKPCHRESEGLSGIYYFFWFKNKNLYNSAIRRHQIDLARLYTEEILKGNLSVIPKDILERLNKNHKQVTGENLLNI